MSKSTIVPRIVPTSQMETSMAEQEWSEPQHEPRMVGISGGLSVSGGDFGFQVPASDLDDLDAE